VDEGGNCLDRGDGTEEVTAVGEADESSGGSEEGFEVG